MPTSRATIHAAISPSGRQPRCRSAPRWRPEGEICVGCGSKQMRVSNDRACCDDCGEERDLAALRAHQISASELDAMMKPQGKQGFWD